MAGVPCPDLAHMPTHYATPEYFLEPGLADQRRFAVLALDPASAVPVVIGALTGFVKGRSVVSGQIGTPQICVRKTADPGAVLSALAEGLNEVAKPARTDHGGLLVSGLTSVKRSRYRESETTGTATLDLSSGPEENLQEAQGTRSEIRHAISAGLEVRQAAGRGYSGLLRHTERLEQAEGAALPISSVPW